MTVTRPCLILDMDDVTYHRDPIQRGSLSSSELRRLNECPARFHWYRTTGQQDFSAEFDLGHAAHKLVLGAGAAIVPIDAPDWRTKDAREARDEARAANQIPMLRKEWDVACGMAKALVDHPLASKLIDHDHGSPEASLFWQHTEDVWGRARIDWLPDNIGRRRILVDYKTSVSADPDDFGKAAARYGYHQQDDWYRRGFAALHPNEPEPGFVFVVQEKRAPYLVSVVELDPYAREIGRSLNDRAVKRYQECVATGEWPGYPPTVHQAVLPRWAEHEYEQGDDE